MKHYRMGLKVRVARDNDNDGYDSFRDKVLRIVHVAKNRNEHPGYDEGISPEYLYDLETLDGESIGSSLYDYELESAR